MTPEELIQEALDWVKRGGMYSPQHMQDAERGALLAKALEAALGVDPSAGPHSSAFMGWGDGYEDARKDARAAAQDAINREEPPCPTS